MSEKETIEKFLFVHQDVQFVCLSPLSPSKIPPCLSSLVEVVDCNFVKLSITQIRGNHFQNLCGPIFGLIHGCTITIRLLTFEEGLVFQMLSDFRVALYQVAELEFVFLWLFAFTPSPSYWLSNSKDNFVCKACVSPNALVELVSSYDFGFKGC